MFSMQITRAITHWPPTTQWKYLCVCSGCSKQDQINRFEVHQHNSVACINTDHAVLSRSPRIPSSSVCYHSSALNTWKHLLFKNNWEPQGQRVIQTLRFLGWFCAPPAISRKTSGLNGLADSREKQKACQSPAEREFNLVTYRTAKGSWYLQVCIPDYYPSNY